MWAQNDVAGWNSSQANFMGYEYTKERKTLVAYLRAINQPYLDTKNRVSYINILYLHDWSVKIFEETPLTNRSQVLFSKLRDSHSSDSKIAI